MVLTQLPQPWQPLSTQGMRDTTEITLRRTSNYLRESLPARMTRTVVPQVDNELQGMMQPREE